jgi:DNA-binding transcriptional LysR family regulator
LGLRARRFVVGGATRGAAAFSAGAGGQRHGDARRVLPGQTARHAQGGGQGAVSAWHDDGAIAPAGPQGADRLQRLPEQAFIQVSQVSPIHNLVQPEFSQFWKDLEPAIACNSTTMAKRMIIAGRGISFFSRIGLIDEIARGEVVWHPLSNRAVNAIEVGLLVPGHRSLLQVTRQFLERLVRKPKQLELAVAIQ